MTTTTTPATLITDDLLEQLWADILCLRETAWLKEALSIHELKLATELTADQVDAGLWQLKDEALITLNHHDYPPGLCDTLRASLTWRDGIAFNSFGLK